MRKPDRKIEICKSACWETYFLSFGESGSVCQAALKSKMKQVPTKWESSVLLKLKHFSKNKLQSRHSSDPEKLYCEHIQP